jgi:hypothetical protein
MKIMLPTTQYTFSSASNNIDFSVYPDFDPKRLLAVINTTVGQTLIYATGGGPSSPTGGSFSGTLGSYILTLTFNCGAAGMSDADVLQIIYDESVGTEEAKASIDIVSGKAGLDVNLLNSSFGGTVGDVMPAPFQDNALSIGVLNGGVLESPAMNVNNELIVDVTQSGSVPVSIAGVLSTDLASFNGGNGLTPTQPLPATPTNPATGSYQTFGSGVSDANTQRVVIASNQVVLTAMPDLFITGQAAQTAIVANILTDPSSATSTDVAGYRSASVQVVSTGTSGTYIFEGSNDNVSFQVIPVFNQALVTGAAITTAITANVSQAMYVFPIQTRYIRLRIVTTIGGGSIRAHTRISQSAYSPASFHVSNNTIGNLNANVAVASGTLTSVTTVSSVTSANLAIPFIVADAAAAALTTTTTSGAIVPSLGISYQVNMPITIVSGTNPTLDVSIEESDDTGTNWYKVYDFPRITSTGIYRSPHIPFFGNRLRYVQTVGGTTPSFTRAFNRLQSSYPALPQRQLISRTIDLNTLNSTTAILLTRDCGNATQLVVNIGSATGSPILQLEGSDDFGSTWYPIGSPLTTTANSTVQATTTTLNSAAVRARVSTAGVGAVMGYVMIKAHD